MPVSPTTHHPDLARETSRPGRLRATFATAVIAGALLLSACASAEPASGPSAVESGDPGAAATPDAVAYAQCMRDNGVPGFPDPNSSGDFAIDANALGVSPESDQYRNAEQTCAPLLPQRSAEQEQDDYQARLAYSQCIRDEGLTEYPDPPVPADGPNVERDNGGGQQNGPGVDISSPQFQAAHEACKHLLPEGDEGPSLSGRP